MSQEEKQKLHYDIAEAWFQFRHKNRDGKGQKLSDQFEGLQFNYMEPAGAIVSLLEHKDII